MMMPQITKAFTNAFPPFPRSAWIHPDVLEDELDRVCKIIWSRAKELPGRGESSAKRPQKVCNLSDNNSRSRDEVLQKEMDDLGLITQCEEDKRQNDSNSTVPCPCPLGQRAEEQQKEDKKKDQSDFLFPSFYHSICRAEEQERGDLDLITQSNGTSAPMQARIQEKAVQTNPKTDTLPVWQQAYDLLGDFPALQAPENPFVLDEFLHGTPKTKAAEVKRGLTYSKKYCQDSGVPHERRVENLPREVPSICLGDQKSALKLQTFGLVSQHNSLPVICEKTKARNQLPPRGVPGTDGVGVNARSWASTAKAGMKQAATPQEKARPYIFQRIVTINRAKIENSAQRFSNKLTFSHHGSSPV